MTRCAYCHKEIPAGEAVKNGKIYTCREHVREGMMVKAVWKDIAFILDDCQYSLVYKLLNPMIQTQNIEKVRYFLADRKDAMSNYLKTKDFSSDYPKICYFKKMLENNLEKYKYVEPKPVVDKPIDDGMSYKIVVPHRKKKRSLNEILGG